MKTATLKCNEEQLRLIQKALDFYSRVGMGQFEEIINHPTFEENLRRQFTPQKELEVGDQTMRGEISEIAEDKSWVKTTGTWDRLEEERTWTDVDQIKLIPDYSGMGSYKKEIEELLLNARHLLYGEYIGRNGSWGIHNLKVDESCREAFNMIQVIRHEFWKQQKNKSTWTVDANVDPWIKNKIEVKIEENELQTNNKSSL